MSQRTRRLAKRDRKRELGWIVLIEDKGWAKAAMAKLFQRKRGTK
jgi:hypothetical protein